jgi:hypothetical protein
MTGRSEPQSTIVPDVVERVIFTAIVNARRRGDQWQALAEEYLGTTEQVLKNIEKTRLELLRNQAAPARAMLEMNENALALLERFADAVWIERGQSQQDPFISILSPGTPNFFFDWPIGRPVDRLELLLDLFARDDSPWLQNSEIATMVGEIRALLPQFRVANEAIRTFRAKIEVLDKAKEVVTRVGHVQYSRLRRRLRADGFDAFEVRKVCPDIPGASMVGTLS